MTVMVPAFVAVVIAVVSIAISTFVAAAHHELHCKQGEDQPSCFLFHIVPFFY